MNVEKSSTLYNENKMRCTSDWFFVERAKNYCEGGIRFYVVFSSFSYLCTSHSSNENVKEKIDWVLLCGYELILALKFN